MEKSKKAIDILLLAEGTYPYIRGGVSTWIHQLISGMPELNFGIVFLGSARSEYDEMRYKLPENLVHLETHYLFEEEGGHPAKRVPDTDSFESIEDLYSWFKSADGDMPSTMKNIQFYTEKVTYKHFLYGKQSWEFIKEKYSQNCPDLPFIDYFWTVRNIHKPIWILADIVKKLPECRLLHSPSTGYAGFLASLASYNTGTPFVLTEHGIYTRERKIDMLTADWIKFQKPTLLKQPEEFNYIKKMWVSFFEQIGVFSYRRADKIFSLFSGARDIQVYFGADRSKTKIIPNGVNVDELGECCLKRPADIPKVITLIGRVVSIKDIKTFIRAVRIVANEIEDIEAWVVGPLDEDPLYAQECINMVETLKLESNFYFKGFQNIKDILPQTGLLTLTSVSEGMPLTILEGYAAGVPCVATDVGSCRDLIYGGLGEEDEAIGRAGAVTPIANPSALAENYIRFLTDNEAWISAQKAALERVQRYYRQDTFLENYRMAYKEVM
ncbi:MAG: glycosyl transferase family 1 [Helicobacteraceae bacterium 4484_230]|nr:MAG: glycosyl transferase family 1 [Helicobacteraceae bacterium 4484_230]